MIYVNTLAAGNCCPAHGPIAQLFAFNSDGSVKWSFAPSETGSFCNGAGAPDVISSPAIAPDGTLYVGALHSVYAVNPDGSQKWAFAVGTCIESSPAVSQPSLDSLAIFFGADNGSLYRLNADGSQTWKFPTGASVVSSPAIGPDGTIYFGSNDSKLYAVH